MRTRARGLTVALLGPDGVGRSTLLAGLGQAYPAPVRQIYMGMWQGAGRPGYTRLHAVAAIVLRPFRVWWRVACGAVHARRGRLVVFDRYTYDALLPITGSWRPLKWPYFWVLAHLAPRPDLVLVLDLPGEVAFARKGEFTAEGWRPSGRDSSRWCRGSARRSSTPPPRPSRCVTASSPGSGRTTA